VALTPAPIDAPAVAGRFGEQFQGRRRLAEAGRRGDDNLAGLHPWARRHLADLAALETGWDAAAEGPSLVHADLRADNLLLTDDRVVVDARIGDLAAKYQGIYPAAAKVLLTDRVGLTACLRFPAEHHHRIRHSDFVERTFGETRRRVKVIGRRPGETSCLTLVWAVLGRASRG
jgi:hypothetical protein